MSFILLVMILMVSPLVLILPDMHSNPELFLLINGLMTAIPFTVAVFVSRWLFDRKSIGSLGLPIRKQAFFDLAAGFGIAGIMQLFMFLVLLGANWLEWTGTAVGSIPLTQVFVLLGTTLIAFFLVGWGEEILFRGYLLVNLREGLNLFWAVLLSSVMFAMLHLTNPDFNRFAMLGLLLSGIFFALTAIWSKGLWLPIGIHIGWNFFEGAIFGFPVSGLDTFRLLLPNVNGPAIWTGGAFGPEAGLILLPGILLGIGLVYGYSKIMNSKPGAFQ